MTKARQTCGGDTAYITEAQNGDLLGICYSRNRIHDL
jgi:hypothetical protein